MTWRDGAVLHLDRVGAIFQVIGVRDGGAGQFAFFAHHVKAEAESQGERRGDQKSTRFDADKNIRLKGGDGVT